MSDLEKLADEYDRGYRRGFEDAKEAYKDREITVGEALDLLVKTGWLQMHDDEVRRDERRK